MSTKTIVGIDAGYGGFKAAFLQTESMTDKPHVLREYSGAGKPEDFIGDIPTHELINVNGHNYVALRKPQEFHAARTTLGETYCTRPEYEANMRLMLHRIGFSRIDTLVLGLPWKATDVDKTSLQRMLEDKYVGDVDTVDGHSVHVERVKAISQPVGALNTVVAGSPELMRAPHATVVIDIGRGTSDWVVFKKGQIWRANSGTSSIASTSILQEMVQLIRKDGHRATVELLEECLYDGQSAYVSRGKQYSLRNGLIDQAAAKSAVQLVNDITSTMATSDKEAMQLDVAYIVGGGSTLFRSSLSSLLEEHLDIVDVRYPDDAVHAIAKGFYISGCQEERLGARDAA